MISGHVNIPSILGVKNFGAVITGILKGIRKMDGFNMVPSISFGSKLFPTKATEISRVFLSDIIIKILGTVRQLS